MYASLKYAHAHLPHAYTKCQGGGAPEAIAVILCGIMIFGLVFHVFKRYFNKREQTHIKTVAKISFVAGQTLVKLPVTFGIQFPPVVSLPGENRNQKNTMTRELIHAPVIHTRTPQFHSFLKMLSIPVFEFSLSMGAECVFPMWLANHFFRTATTTTVPVLIMVFLATRAKLIDRRALHLVGEEPKALQKKKAALYEWTLVISYTMLPPSLNLVFSIFSCLGFEDGSKTLRADHLLSCQVTEG